MAQFPKRFLWTAPTKNVDGSNIAYPLDYEFEAREQGQTAFSPIYSTPGTLNPDGKYTAPLSDMPYFVLGKAYDVALVALNRTTPSDRSVRSNVVSFVIRDETPTPPLDFSVA